MKTSRTISAVTAAALLLTCTITAVPADAANDEMRNMSTMELVQDMGIGINLGNTFDAAGDWIAQYGDGSVKSYETAWGSPVITKEMIQGYKDEGFGVLRIPVAWSNKMVSDGTYTIDKDWMERVTQVVDWAIEADLYTIVNIHWDNGWVNDFPENEDENMKRYTHMWEQISDNFKDYGDHLMFESQNEELGWESLWNKWGGTSGKAESYALVNKINQQFVNTVRSSGGNNTYRHLLLSGYNTGIDETCDPLFEIPYDPVNRLAVSVHYYTPSTFAILEEDADWGKAVSTWGTDAEYKELTDNMDKLKKSFVDKGIPVIIGEYGCPIKNKDPESVRKFLSSVCAEAYKREMCPVLWDTPEGHYDRSICKLSDRQLKAEYAKIIASRQLDPFFPAEDSTVYIHDTFESGTDSWGGRGAASAAVSSANAMEGSSSLAVTGRTSAWHGAIRPLGSEFAAGKTYSFSANVMFDQGPASDTFFLKLQYTAADGTPGYSEIAQGETVKGAWVQLANTSYTIPAGASDIQIYVETPDSTTSFYVDDVYGGTEGMEFKGSGASKKLRRGDIDYDGRISVFDVILGRQLLTGDYESAPAMKAADADGDGTYAINDLVLIQEFVLGRISEFPEPPKPDNIWDDYQETASADWINFYKSSICSMGNTSRLAAKLEAAQNGESLTLGYIGGSITEGKNYSDPFTSYIRNTFAKGSFKEINIGMSGTSSVVGLVRAEKGLAAQNPDIVVIEFSVNDHGDESYKKSFESLIRKFLEMPNEPAVIVLITRSKGGYSSQAQMEASAKNFDVPIISMDNALTKAFNSGFLKADDYFSDEYHPHKQGGQLIADCMAYYCRQAMKTENRSDSYTIPTTSVYGSEYYTCVNMSANELTNFNAGSFTAGNGYDRNNTLSYSYTFQKNSANNAMTFTTTGKGLILVFKANSNGMGTALVTVNGKTTKVSGNKQYTWGGPDAEVAYFQNTSGELNVSIKMENAGTDFTIWGLGVIK